MHIWLYNTLKNLQTWKKTLEHLLNYCIFKMTVDFQFFTIHVKGDKSVIWQTNTRSLYKTYSRISRILLSLHFSKF